MDKQDTMEIISKEFADKYKSKKVNWGFGDLGLIVYKRTYARTKEDGTTEEWYETIRRCINGVQKIGAKYTKEEAERLYDYMFNFKALFSGRGLWQLGTKTLDLVGMDSLLNCFAGKTKVLTRNGWKQIKELSNETHSIVTEGGKWVDAHFSCYGEQELIKLIVKSAYSKNNIEILTTAGHEWIIKTKNGNNRIKTSGLKVGNRLPIVLGKCSTNYLSPQGISHGLVYGDGSCNGYESFVDLIDNTYKFCSKYFASNRISWKNPENLNHVRYGGMPNYYKQLPSVTENKSYLLGFLAGWIAADGNVSESNGSIRLFNKDRQVLLFAKDIASVCGLRTSDPYLERDINPFNNEESELWSISFELYDNPELLIIRDDHIKKLKPINRNKRHTDYASVVSIEKTGIKDKVYCAVVPETHSFVIEGNILTGNCWVTKVSTVDDFYFIFTESMLGGGVGCNISREYTQELPRVKRGVRCRMKNTNDADFIVPDSKEGWAYLWRKILRSYLINGESFTFSNVCIRPAGEPLKTFGGIAPGPKPLMDGAQQLIKILESREGKKLRTQDVADIICCGGEVVKSGGIRRTALILVGDVDDMAFLNLKRWDLDITIPGFRGNSNNSLICNNYNHLLEKYWEGFNGNGEAYGLFNLKNAKLYGRLGETEFSGLNLFNDEIIAPNPCAEALLEDKEACNLAELPINRISSKEEMLDCAILLYKAQKAIAAGKYLFEETNNVIHKRMRLGLGVTGVCQVPQYKEWCDYVYKELRKFDKKYSKENGWPQSIRLTVVKPSGTLSLLSGSSPGGNPGYSKYHYRTVRFSYMDQLVLILKNAGYKIEPEIKIDGTLNHDINVVYFPCEFSDETVCQDKSNAIDQLERIKHLQTYWADQAVSNTVYYTKEELPAIKEWLAKNYNNSIKTVSFLLHIGHGFKQAVLQPITKEEYESALKAIKPVKLVESSNEIIDGLECASGACPVR